MRRCFIVWLFVGIVLLADSALAHDPFEITTLGRVRENCLELVVTMTRSAALRLLTGSGEPQQSLEAEQLAELQSALMVAGADLFEVTSGGQKLDPRTIKIGSSEDNEVTFHLEFSRPEPGPLVLSATHLTRLDEGYGNAVVLKLDQPETPLGLKFLTSLDSTIDTVIPSNGPVNSDEPEEPAPTGFTSIFSSFFYLGIEHIFLGYDHLLFLAGLLLGCQNLRSMLILVSCFTAAHSLTLALAALNVVPVHERVVESLIAASIVVVGVQNFLTAAEPKRRYLFAIGFGLIHGLGFAGALRGLGLGVEAGEVIVPLLSFNLGVEVGQIAIAGLALPVLLRLRKFPRGPLGFRWASLLIAVLGAYWFFQRSVST